MEEIQFAAEEENSCPVVGKVENPLAAVLID
jgi:hypothetical protein